MTQKRTGLKLDFTWDDETVDPLVDEMVRLIFECFEFKKEMFVGGLTSVELARLRLEKKNKDKETKDKDEKEHLPEFTEFESSEAPQSSSLANLLGTMMKDLVGDIEGRVRASVQLAVQHAMHEAQKSFDASLGCGLEKMQVAVPVLYRLLWFLPNPDVVTEACDVIDAVLDEINGLAPASQSNVVGDSCRRSSPLQNNTPNLDGQTTGHREPVPEKPVEPTLPPVLHSNVDKSNRKTQASQQTNVDAPPSASSESNVADVFPAEKIAVNLGEPDAVEENTKQPDDPTSASLPASIEEPNTIRDSLDFQEMHIPYNLLEIPSFSLGLSQEEVPEIFMDVNLVNYVISEEQDHGGDGERRRSKRPQSKPVGLNDFQCDPKIGLGHNINPKIGELFSDLQYELSQKTVIEISLALNISPIEFSDIALRPQHITPKVVIDALMHFLARHLPNDDLNVQIFDTTLPASLIKQHSRLVKTAVKDRPKLKFSASSVIILDCNVAFKSESQLKKDLNPVANLMPYIVKFAKGMEITGSQTLFSLIRAKGIPQIVNPGDAAVMAVLLIEAHVNVGLQALKGITSRILPDAAKQLAVNFYNDITI
ncbi:hypothetical protein Bca52824_036237 [Brassica carinata]|uniref:Ubiquitin-like protease family profile domain-containing protein n=1 Tax=Brassica carinata TaxID=52824 RepID=A0A8X7S4D8_BRACI|nr:hypothetical protein Bca52824_036237 [Brassica carinata]